MSKLNLNDNLFIGTQELKQFQQNSNFFYTILGYLTKHYGFVELKDSINENLESNCWKVLPSTGGIFTISSPSYAFAYPNKLISWNNPSKIIQVPDSYKDSIFWVKISYAEDNFEQGILKVNSNGDVVGTNTLFTEKLRGEPNFASTIELFTYDINSSLWLSKGQYLVESVNTDTSIVLSKENGLPDTSLSYTYKIIGTFPVGTVIDYDIKYPYIYDGCEVELIKETNVNKAPNEEVMMLDNTSFYIARMIYSAEGILSVDSSDVKKYFEVENGYEEKYSKWWSLK